RHRAGEMTRPFEPPAPAEGTPEAPLVAPRRGGLRRCLRGGTVAAAILATAAVALIAVGPRFLPYRLVPVQGASMEPTIHLGSLAVMRPVRAADVRVGDIIIFGRSDIADELVTHRVVRIVRTVSGPVFLTKGDANGAPDRPAGRRAGPRRMGHGPRRVRAVHGDHRVTEQHARHRNRRPVRR